jgi:hypothetical protein
MASFDSESQDVLVMICGSVDVARDVITGAERGGQFGSELALEG